MASEYHGYQSHEIDPAGMRACSDALAELRAHLPGFVSAGVVGPDGFEVAALTTRPIEISKLAALSTTLVAVAEAFALEAGMTSCREVILESDSGGTTLLLGVTVQDANYALFVIAEKAITLGFILTRARRCAAEIQGILAEHSQAEIPQ